MKGVVFTELIEFVEEMYGFDTVDEVVEKSGLECIYTQAGNYPFEELVKLVVALSEIKGASVEELLVGYGNYLFTKLIQVYPHVEKFSSAFDLISKVDNVIHPEVLKLYPDADLPTFKLLENSDERILLAYISNKGIAPFAKGLIEGAGKYYNENLDVILHTEKTPVEIEVIKR